MPGTFAYTESTNKIVVTDGTSGAPATFNDMYTADQAGTATDLLPAEAGTSGPGNSLTYAIRPTGDKALIIKCIVAAKTAEADFIFITGTDAWGAAQTESLDVTAGNGTYTSTKRFATATEFDCSDNAAGGGTQWADGTIQVTQDIWGVVWEHVADKQYKLDCLIDIGDDSTATYFRSSNEEVVLTEAVVVQINATLSSGTKTGSWGTGGSSWSFDGLSAWNMLSGGTLNIYASKFHFNTSGMLIEMGTGSVEILNSILSAEHTAFGTAWWFNSNLTSVILKDVFIDTCYALYLYKTTTIENIQAHNTDVGIVLNNANATITDVLITNSSSADARVFTTNNPVLTFKDPKANIGTLIIGTATSAVIEQYTCNIHIADEDGADLQGVLVDCEYAHLVEGDDNQTYICTTAHTSVSDANDGQPPTNDGNGNWTLYSTASGYGDWNASFAYKSGTQEFAQQTTDSGGDITEQNIQYKKWLGTSEVEESRIHKFTLTYGGDTHIAEKFIVSMPIVWHLEFPPQATILSDILSRIGTPVALDGGSATLSGMLTKMADDNGGADFNAARESLNIIRTRGDLAWTTGVGASASNIYTIATIARTVGDDDGGSDTDVDVVDGTYFSTGEVTSTTKLEVDATFTATDASENPNSVDVWGYYASGGGHYIAVQAYNYIDSTFEEIGQMGNASVVSFHSYPLNAQHINTSTGAMAIKFLHSAHSGIITHALHIDKIVVGTTEESIIDANIDLILEDTNEIQGKLPDNYIMGSSDTEDHDDEIDAIVANLGNTHSVEDESPGGGGRAPSTTSGIAEGC